MKDKARKKVDVGCIAVCVCVCVRACARTHTHTPKDEYEREVCLFLGMLAHFLE